MSKYYIIQYHVYNICVQELIDRRYFTGEKVLCFHGPLIYEAKCLEAEVRDKQVNYLIHYAGWNKKLAVYNTVSFEQNYFLVTSLNIQSYVYKQNPNELVTFQLGRMGTRDSSSQVHGAKCANAKGHKTRPRVSGAVAKGKTECRSQRQREPKAWTKGSQ